MVRSPTVRHLETSEETRKRSWLVDVSVRLVKEKPLATVGGVIVVVLFLVGILADLIAPYGMNEMHMADALMPPNGKYLLGTDDLGRDLLSRVIIGARISMIVGLAGAGIATATSAIIGLLSGFLGGKFDIIVQRFVDAWMCFPGLFLILSVMAILGSGIVQVIVVLGLLYGIGGSRVIRGAVIGIKENMYVGAAVVIGAPTWRILLRHILPNIWAPIIVLFTVRMGSVIIVEATLSFLGFGIPPPQPSWGGMLSGSGRRFLLQAPWMALWPGLALGIVVYGINVLGDGLRDILDPRLRGGVGRYGTKNIKRGQKESIKYSGTLTNE